ncbi:MAG: hypothetical protein ABID38_07635 [Candidatus Diapherotrites archaeon]
MAKKEVAGKVPEFRIFHVDDPSKQEDLIKDVPKIYVHPDSKIILIQKDGKTISYLSYRLIEMEGVPLVHVTHAETFGTQLEFYKRYGVIPSEEILAHISHVEKKSKELIGIISSHKSAKRASERAKKRGVQNRDDLFSYGINLRKIRWFVRRKLRL